MTLPPHGSPHYELRRRITFCRERLRKARTTQREVERAAPSQGATEQPGEETEGDGEEDEGRAHKLNSSRWPAARRPTKLGAEGRRERT